MPLSWLCLYIFVIRRFYTFLRYKTEGYIHTNVLIFSLDKVQSSLDSFFMEFWQLSLFLKSTAFMTMSVSKQSSTKQSRRIKFIFTVFFFTAPNLKSRSIKVFSTCGNVRPAQSVFGVRTHFINLKHQWACLTILRRWCLKG